MLNFLIMAAAVSPTIDCKNALTTADVLTCSVRDYHSADLIMNRQYRAAVASMVAMDGARSVPGDKRASYYNTLLASQRAWLKFRDAQCAAEGYMARGGSMEPLLVTSCMEELTKARAKQLNDLTKGLGD